MTRKIDLAGTDISIAKIERLNWLLTALMALAGGLFFSLLAAKSILVGGMIANISFTLMKRDTLKAMQGPLSSVKLIFLLKYYVKLPALALLLYFVIKHGQLAIAGLLIGLSSVVLSVGYTAVCEFIRYSGSKKKNLEPGIVDKGHGSCI